MAGTQTLWPGDGMMAGTQTLWPGDGMMAGTQTLWPGDGMMAGTQTLWPGMGWSFLENILSIHMLWDDIFVQKSKLLYKTCKRVEIMFGAKS